MATAFARVLLRAACVLRVCARVCAVPNPRMRSESGAAQRRKQNRQGSVVDGNLSYEHVAADVDSPSVTQDMTCGDLCGWLANKGREDIVDMIQEHQLEGADLLEMSAEDLEVDFEAENAEELFNLIHGKPHHYHAGEDIPSAATEFEDDGTGIATYETGAYNITCAHALCECMCVVCRCGCGCVALCVSTTMLALLPLPPTLQHPPHPST